jgi:hypothetical protein
MLCCTHHHAAGGNYSGAFVNEFKIFVAELRDFFNAVGLTQLLDGVKNGMSAEDQQVCILLRRCWRMHLSVCLGGGGACWLGTGGALLKSSHHTLNQSNLLGDVKSGMGNQTCLAISRAGWAPRTKRCAAAAVSLGRGILILGQGGRSMLARGWGAACAKD